MTLAAPVLLAKVLKDPQNLGPFSSGTVGMATEPGEHTRVIDQRGPEYQINGTLLQPGLYPPRSLVGCARLRSVTPKKKGDRVNITDGALQTGWW